MRWFLLTSRDQRHWLPGWSLDDMTPTVLMHLWRMDSWMRLSLPSSPMNLMLPSILIFAIERCSSSSAVSSLSFLSKTKHDDKNDDTLQKNKTCSVNIMNATQETRLPYFQHFWHGSQTHLEVLKSEAAWKSENMKPNVVNWQFLRFRNNVCTNASHESYSILLLCCLAFVWGVFKVWCILRQALT